MEKSLDDIIRKLERERKEKKNQEELYNQKKLEEQKRWAEHVKYLRRVNESFITLSNSTAAGAGGHKMTQSGIPIPLPETISELKPAIWYTANDVVVDGSNNVMQFNDISDNENHAYPIEGSLVYNVGTTVSQGGNDYIQMTNAVAGATNSLPDYVETTVIVVYKSPTTNRQSIYGSVESVDFRYHQMSFENTGGQLYLYSGNGSGGQTTGMTVDIATSSIAGVTNVYCGEHTIGGKSIIFNGLYKVSGALAYNPFGVSWTPTIGSNNRKMDGEWYEMIIFDRVLSLEEKDVVFGSLGDKYGITMSLWKDLDDRVGLYGIVGQSNAGGRGAINTELLDKYDGTQSGVFISSGSQVAAPLVFDKAGNNSNGGSIAGRFGVEASLGYEYKERTGTDMYLVKSGPGGTLLYDDNITNGIQTWYPRTTTEAPNILLTGGWLVRYYRTLVELQNNNLYPYRPTVMIWQGEQDATSATFSNAYESNGDDWVNAIADNLGYNNPYNYMDIELTKISVNNDLGDQPFLETVREAQENIALKNPDIVNLNIIDDNIKYTVFDVAHVDGEGLITYGIELQEKYQNI